MAKKVVKRDLVGCVKIIAETQRQISYANYFNNINVFLTLQILNNSAEEVENIAIHIEDNIGVILPYKKVIESLPYESSVSIKVENLLSPLALSELHTTTESVIKVYITHEDKILNEVECKVNVLPFDFWGGTEGDITDIACFVRPKMQACGQIMTNAQKQLSKWNISTDFDGYNNVDKNKVRQIFASIYASLSKANINLIDSEEDIKFAQAIGDINSIMKSKQATKLQLSILIASCLESCGLYPVLLFGENEATVGVWLTDNSFIEPSSDDVSLIGKYVADGINNISVIDINDIFLSGGANFSMSENHFKQRLANDSYNTFVDIRRCRLGEIRPLPIKITNLLTGRTEILEPSDLDNTAKPRDINNLREVNIDIKQPKNKQWERKLLDMSLRNTLLNFNPEKNCLHVMAGNIFDTFVTMLAGDSFKVLPVPNDLKSVESDIPLFMNAKKKIPLQELTKVEFKNKRLHTFYDEEKTISLLNVLIKKNRTLEEETGASLIYLSFGFLKWISVDKQTKYAPIVLLPVKLEKTKKDKEHLITLTGDVTINTTLLEYLKQEFNIDIRGLDNLSGEVSLEEVFSIVKREILSKKDWEICEDVYLAPFTFARYAMWNDLRQNIDLFKKNPLISSLLENRLNIKKLAFETLDEDDIPSRKLLTPLMADTSQLSAIASANENNTFVLHGPPGTGKSQTITNIIANALANDRRVLFVAEKQAALSVVKKRLDSIGIGDFCMQLHSSKTDKNEVAKTLEKTLSLHATFDEKEFIENADRIDNLRKDLNEPIKALHTKRRLGVSVYEAILLYLKNKNSPDLLDIESTFYDNLTKEKLDRYEELLIELTGAIKECGGVYHSPFENVNLTEFDTKTKDSIYCACEVLLQEIKHFKNYLALFYEFYRQRISTFTFKKFENLKTLLTLLNDDSIKKYYECEETEFNIFFNANRRLDELFKRYFEKFKSLIDVSKEYTQIESELDNWSENYRSSKLLVSVLKKLERASKMPLSSKDEVASLKLIKDIYVDLTLLNEKTTMAKEFMDKNVINFKKRDEFLNKLTNLHELCGTIFIDYNADSFNSMCVRAQSGFLNPILSGLNNAISSFESAVNLFSNLTKAEKGKLQDEDILLYYTNKCSQIIDNIDVLSSWCIYKSTEAKLRSEGLEFMTDYLNNGKVNSTNILSSFKKNVYKNFIETSIILDPVLSRFSSQLLDDKIELFKRIYEEYVADSKKYIFQKLVSKLPDEKDEGSLSLELVAFKRITKSNLRGYNLKSFLSSIPNLSKVLMPCILMSPATVSQYLSPECDFDLVIFDEASQLPTSEAISALARAKNALIVGDEKQLPPTTFFSSGFIDEENLENEDLDSILDDCLALGVPSKHLLWHYRSKHESLISFSNTMYYGNKLSTFPSPDNLESRVKMCYLENGVYERGGTKQNKAEADALVAEVIRRLQDDRLSRSSIGIITFSTIQQELIERRLSKALYKNKLEDKAYDRDEPIFVKNLENVQGDERDVILFSVCYGPDKTGKLSLNFGPLNQLGGWRRLNVAVSRAREEMTVYSSMTSSMIDLSKTKSRGVAGLKAFLEFADRGKLNLPISIENINRENVGIGRYIANELKNCGFECRYDLGVSDFKIDCAVIDPNNKKKFILAIMCDGETAHKSSAKDRTILQSQTLMRNNWNVMRVYTINFINNPKREIKRIKDTIERLIGGNKNLKQSLSKYKKTYKYLKIESENLPSTFITSGENDNAIISRIKSVVSIEEPISEEFVIKRVLQSFGIQKGGTRIDDKIKSLLALTEFKYEEILGRKYYRKTNKCLETTFYRVETEEPLRKTDSDFTPYEILAIIRGILENRVSIYADELEGLILAELKITRSNQKVIQFIHSVVQYGEDKHILLRSISDKISLA